MQKIKARPHCSRAFKSLLSYELARASLSSLGVRFDLGGIEIPFQSRCRSIQNQAAIRA